MDYAFGEEMVWAVKMSKVIIARCAKYTHDVCIKKKSCWVYKPGTDPTYLMPMQSIQFSSAQSLDRLFRLETCGTIQQTSFSRLFCRRSLWEVLALARLSTLWCCPSSISSADHGVAHPPRCTKEWFWRGCCGVWYPRTMQVSASRSGSCEPAKELILFRTQLLVLKLVR